MIKELYISVNGQDSLLTDRFRYNSNYQLIKYENFNEDPTESYYILFDYVNDHNNKVIKANYHIPNSDILYKYVIPIYDKSDLLIKKIYFHDFYDKGLKNYFVDSLVYADGKLAEMYEFYSANADSIFKINYVQKYAYYADGNMKTVIDEDSTVLYSFEYGKTLNPFITIADKLHYTKFSIAFTQQNNLKYYSSYYYRKIETFVIKNTNTQGFITQENGESELNLYDNKYYYNYLCR